MKSDGGVYEKNISGVAIGAVPLGPVTVPVLPMPASISQLKSVSISTANSIKNSSAVKQK